MRRGASKSPGRGDKAFAKMCELRRRPQDA